MALEPRIADLLKKHEMPQDSVWQHKQSSQWIIKHKALEVIAAKEGIIFDMPVVVQLDLLSKVACVVVKGHIIGTLTPHSTNILANRSEWSFGEATADNCKMGYFAAMAEKRAKDRVALKLLNLHGDVYSEEEADDFKQPAFKTAKARTELFKAVKDRIEKCDSLAELAEEWMCSQDDIQRLRNEDEQFFADLENTKNRMKKAFQDSQAMDARVPA